MACKRLSRSSLLENKIQQIGTVAATGVVSIGYLFLFNS